MLAVDATLLYAHIESGRVFPTTYRIGGEVLEGYEAIGRVATSPSHIVPGQDPAVLDRYPLATPGLEGWVVRLDLHLKQA